MKRILCTYIVLAILASGCSTGYRPYGKAKQQKAFESYQRSEKRRNAHSGR